MTPRSPYDTDVSDAQWELIKGMIPAVKEGGRNALHERREILNAIRYQTRSGVQWRLLPHDFPPWKTVYDYFRTWTREGVWERINTALRESVRMKAGRNPKPSLGIMDSQSTKTTEAAGPRGFDAGKKVKGRKRHVMVDVMGMLIAVVVHSAGIQDRDGGRLVVNTVPKDQNRIERIIVDSIYTGGFDKWVKKQRGWIVEIVNRDPEHKGFKPLPKRWVVERTFAWMGRSRRLSKDYERRPDHSAAFVYLAMQHVMLKRLAA